MKAGFRRAIALSLGLSALTIPASAATIFTDVPSTYWGYSYITEAASDGLVSGIGNGKYGPEQTLSNAQFVTMVCNLFYADQVRAQGNSADWWRPYMNVAYSNKLLNGTSAGQNYAATGSWNSSSVNAQISRYDMAQIMYNLSTTQNWESPDSMSLVLSQVLIKDFGSIPTNYQMPVAYCYAKGFLTGDQNSNFNGSATTTRAQAAVVLCALNDEKSEATAPTFPNSNRLTNGLAATEENVANLIDDVWASYPDYDQWNVNTTYTSQRLGVGTGSRGFVYMLSDKIFGGMPANQIDDPADLRLGDVISFDSGSQYGLVCEANENTFSYVTCDSSGFIDWSNDMYRDNLDRYDTVYTRYLNMPEPDDVLSNGKDATRENVEDLLADLRRDDNYESGTRWRINDDYESDVLGEAEGARALAYKISDEIFGDLDYVRGEDEDDLRIGDIIYDRDGSDGYGIYGVVVDIDYGDGEYTYVSIDEDDERIYWNFTGKLNHLNLNSTYTRYPEDADYDYDRDDETLADGSSITPNHVADLLTEVLNDVRDDENGYWNMSRRYNSYMFDDNAKGDEAFVYYISDQVFGERKNSPMDVDEPEDLKIGDIIFDDSDDYYRYGIVVDIDVNEQELWYASVDDDGDIRMRVRCNFDDLDQKDMQTRYR